MIRRLISIALLGPILALANDPFVDEFESLDGWKPLTFAKIDKHSKYESTSRDGHSLVKLSADASASGMVSKTTFSPEKLPYLTFRWQVDQVWSKGDATRQDGDDYPVRIYVTFVYDPKKASFTERLLFKAAKLRHGEFPPHSSLNYIWANRAHAKRILASPYTDRAQLVVVDQGTTHVGTWRTHTVNILEDYRKAFGEDPPAEARLAIMIDADNTNDKGQSWIDFVRLSATPPKK